MKASALIVIKVVVSIRLTRTVFEACGKASLLAIMMMIMMMSWMDTRREMQPSCCIEHAELMLPVSARSQ